MDKKQLKSLIERVLDYLDLRSDAAVNLILGTIAQESHLGKYIRQIKGPARGIIQMEPATEQDIWANYLAYKSPLAKRIVELRGDYEGFDLEANLAYQIAICRVHYLRVPKALPQADDIKGLASYWKKYYNTELGAGTKIEFIENYHRFIL